MEYRRCMCSVGGVVFGKTAQFSSTITRESQEYQILNVNEIISIIVRTPSGKILLFCKASLAKHG